MAVVSFSSVSLTFGVQKILDAASFSLPAGAKVGLIGENGCGKSTILKLICREITPYTGVVETARDLSISHYRQLAQLELDSSETGQLQFAELVARYSEAGGYELEGEASRILVGLSFTESQLQLPFACLSGGEQARVNLAAALLTDPQLLLLDEPDSHLDLAGRDWLANRLNSFHGTMLLVSHDRDLLERCTDSILELEDGDLRHEAGLLAAYFVRKQQRLAEQSAMYLEQQRVVRKLKSDIRRTEEKARSFDSRSTNDHWRRIGKKIAKTAVARKHRLERELDEANRVDRPEQRDSIKLKLAAGIRHSDCLLLATDLSVSVGGRCLFSKVGLELHRGQRLALSGANGSGKTMLLEALMGNLEPAGGEVWFPRAASVFYCDQQHAGLDPGLSAIEVLEAGTALSLNQIRYALSQIGLKNHAAHRHVSVLSGGERTRLLLALLANSSADLLVLDEPTAHLDLPSIEVLEQVLMKFDGSVLFVSHDRRFISAVATEVLLLESCVLRQSARLAN